MFFWFCELKLARDLNTYSHTYKVHHTCLGQSNCISPLIPQFFTILLAAIYTTGLLEKTQRNSQTTLRLSIVDDSTRHRSLLSNTNPRSSSHGSCFSSNTAKYLLQYSLHCISCFACGKPRTLQNITKSKASCRSTPRLIPSGVTAWYGVLREMMSHTKSAFTRFAITTKSIFYVYCICLSCSHVTLQLHCVRSMW